MKAFSFFVFPVIICSLSLFVLATILHAETGKKVRSGAEVLLGEQIFRLKGKHIGLVTNHTALLPNGVHLADTLAALKENFSLVALFGPEHGIRGQAGAGEKIENSTDAATGVPVYSLYGKHKKPTNEMLSGINLLIFDIQDVGSRFYTYISTLYYTIEAAAENNIPIIILDRPNPAAPLGVLGPIREEGLSSFVGIAPIPIAHGMTIGELAKYYAGELIKNKNLDLTVVQMTGYKRSMYYFETGLTFTKPSPNIMEEETMLLYPGTCLFEGTNLSEGRGTYSPFLLFGAPYIDNQKLLTQLQVFGYTDVQFEAAEFTPVALEGIVNNPKYKNELCRGIKMVPSNKMQSDPILLTIRILSLIANNHPADFKFREKSIDILSGSSKLKQQILAGVDPDTIYHEWQTDINSFKKIRNGYLIYE